MNLEELGAALRAEREKRGLSIEDVANHLKIGVRLLRALEEGDSSSLPHAAYARGFIRSYAGYLGLSDEETHAALQSLFSPGPAEAQPVYVPEVTSTSGGRSLRWLGWLALLVLLVGGLYTAWQQGAFDFLNQQNRRLAQPSPPLQSPDPSSQMPESVTGRTAAQPAAQATAPADRKNTAAQTATEGSRGSQAAGEKPAAPTAAAAPQGGEQAAGPASEKKAAETARTDGAAEKAAAGQHAAPVEGGLPAGQHKVVITATEECWIHSTADKTDTRQFSLQKGDTFALTFTRSLQIKLGNAGGVQIRYNGQDMPPAGQSGQVRTLHFPPAAEQ